VCDIILFNRSLIHNFDIWWVFKFLQIHWTIAIEILIHYHDSKSFLHFSCISSTAVDYCICLSHQVVYVECIDYNSIFSFCCVFQNIQLLSGKYDTLTHWNTFKEYTFWLKQEPFYFSWCNFRQDGVWTFLSAHKVNCSYLHHLSLLQYHTTHCTGVELLSV